MHNLVRLVVWIFLLLVFISSIGFSFLNTTPVPLSFGAWTMSPQPVAFWIVSAFALGGVLGLVFGTGLRRLLNDRREIRRMRAQLDSVKKQLPEPNTQSPGDTE
jgi:putative membrane protein